MVMHKCFHIDVWAIDKHRLPSLQDDYDNLTMHPWMLTAVKLSARIILAKNHFGKLDTDQQHVLCIHISL